MKPRYEAAASIGPTPLPMRAIKRSAKIGAAEIRASVLVELLEKLDGSGWLVERIRTKPMAVRATEMLPLLKGTKFMNIGEFGRTVHAEMASLMDAARRGVSVDNLTIYVTTFPCHNCAKHLIAAGIRKVVYLEPYPKSR